MNVSGIPEANSWEPALAIRWYRLYIDPVNRIPGLAAWGEISDQKKNFDYFNPSIISLGKDDYTIVSFSRSGGTGYDSSGSIGAYAAILPPETVPGATPDFRTLQAVLYILFMRSTYSVSEAQAQLPTLLKRAENEVIVISRRDKTVAYLVSAQRMEAIVETLELTSMDRAGYRCHRRGRYLS